MPEKRIGKKSTLKQGKRSFDSSGLFTKKRRQKKTKQSVATPKNKSADLQLTLL